MRRNGLTLFITIYILLLWSCANQTTPTGGPKDEAPPRLLKSTPSHKERNFKGKEIELTFDEAINLNNPKTEILISPRSDQEIEYKYKKNTVTIIPEIGWDENTTYSLSFREGIRDITENNAPENLKLAFSTGPLIDSMMVQGKTKMAINTDLPEKITVALYQSDTFNIFEHSPNYFTLISAKGAFSLENIKNGTYYIYAFQDKSNNLKVESRTEKFGFLKEPLVLDGPIDSLTIPMINLDMRLLSINNIRKTEIQTRINFNKSVVQYSVQAESEDHLINSFGDNQSEIVIYNPSIIKDSLKISLQAFDSIQSQIDTTFYIKPIKTNSIPSDFKVSSGPIQYNLRTNTLSQEYRLSKPIKYFNTDSIYIKIDSLNLIPLTDNEFTYDTIYKKLYFSKVIPSDTLFKKPELPEKTEKPENIKPKVKGASGTKRTPTSQAKPELIITKGSIISQEMDTLATQKFPITEVKKANTGTLLIEVQTKEQDYIIQLITPDGSLIEEVTNINKYTFQYLQPKNYKIKVILDRNKNGKWDPGNFFKREEPEPIWFYQTQDKKYNFPIRANWELGPLLLTF